MFCFMEHKLPPLVVEPLQPLPKCLVASKLSVRENMRIVRGKHRASRKPFEVEGRDTTQNIAVSSLAASVHAIVYFIL